jgi:hypothetical protein
LVRKREDYYLVTNYHLATGFECNDSIKTDVEGSVPDELYVYFHQKRNDSFFRKVVYLYDKNGERNFFTIPSRSSNKMTINAREITDLVFIPLGKLDDNILKDTSNAYNKQISVIKSKSFISIWGFRTSKNQYPVCDTAILRSEMTYHKKNKYIYFTDHKNLAGDSGFPVCIQSNNRPEFMGIHSEGDSAEFYHKTFTKSVFDGTNQYFGVTISKSLLNMRWRIICLDGLIKYNII